MTIYNISNFTKFFNTLDLCDDELTLVMPDGKAYDWKQNKPFLLSFLQTLDVEKCNKMEIRPNDTKDASRSLCYMMEGERKS